MPESAADLPLVSVLAGQAIAMAATGVVASAIALVVVERPWVFLVSAICGGAVAVGVGWLLGRRLNRNSSRDLPRLLARHADRARPRCCWARSWAWRGWRQERWC